MHFGDGNISLSAKSVIGSNLIFKSGNIFLNLGGVTESNIQTGNGNDTIQIKNNIMYSTINTGEGNDTISSHEATNSYIFAGTGKNSVMIERKTNTSISVRV